MDRRTSLKLMRKRKKLYPWLRSFCSKYSEKFFKADNAETFEYLFLNIDKEMKKFYLDMNKDKAEDFYNILSSIFLHFWWQIRWKSCKLWKTYWKKAENSVSSTDDSHRKCCIQLLYYLIVLSIFLTDGDESSDWIGRILTTIKSLPGALDLLCSALLLIDDLKKKHKPVYKIILQNVLCCEAVENIIEPETYCKVILLFRRVLKLTKEKESMVVFTSKLKSPSHIHRWFREHNIEESKRLNYDNLTQELLSRSYPDKLLRKLSEILVQPIYPAKSSPAYEAADTTNQINIVSSTDILENSFSANNKLNPESSTEVVNHDVINSIESTSVISDISCDSIIIDNTSDTDLANPNGVCLGETCEIFSDKISLKRKLESCEIEQYSTQKKKKVKKYETKKSEPSSHVKGHKDELPNFKNKQSLKKIKRNKEELENNEIDPTSPVYIKELNNCKKKKSHKKKKKKKVNNSESEPSHKKKRKEKIENVNSESEQSSHKKKIKEKIEDVNSGSEQSFHVKESLKSDNYKKSSVKKKKSKHDGSEDVSSSKKKKKKEINLNDSSNIFVSPVENHKIKKKKRSKKSKKNSKEKTRKFDEEMTEELKNILSVLDPSASPVGAPNPLSNPKMIAIEEIEDSSKMKKQSNTMNEKSKNRKILKEKSKNSRKKSSKVKKILNDENVNSIENQKQSDTPECLNPNDKISKKKLDLNGETSKSPKLSDEVSKKENSFDPENPVEPKQSVKALKPKRKKLFNGELFNQKLSPKTVQSSTSLTDDCNGFSAVISDSVTINSSDQSDFISNDSNSIVSSAFNSNVPSSEETTSFSDVSISDLLKLPKVQIYRHNAALGIEDQSHFKGKGKKYSDSTVLNSKNNSAPIKRKPFDECNDQGSSSSGNDLLKASKKILQQSFESEPCSSKLLTGNSSFNEVDKAEKELNCSTNDFESEKELQQNFESEPFSSNSMFNHKSLEKLYQIKLESISSLSSNDFENKKELQPNFESESCSSPSLFDTESVSEETKNDSNQSSEKLSLRDEETSFSIRCESTSLIIAKHSDNEPQISIVSELKNDAHLSLLPTDCLSLPNTMAEVRPQKSVSEYSADLNSNSSYSASKMVENTFSHSNNSSKSPIQNTLLDKSIEPYSDFSSEIQFKTLSPVATCLEVSDISCNKLVQNAAPSDKSTSPVSDFCSENQSRISSPNITCVKANDSQNFTSGPEGEFDFSIKNSDVSQLESLCTNVKEKVFICSEDKPDLSNHSGSSQHATSMECPSPRSQSLIPPINNPGLLKQFPCEVLVDPFQQPTNSGISPKSDDRNVQHSRNEMKEIHLKNAGTSTESATSCDFSVNCNLGDSINRNAVPPLQLIINLNDKNSFSISNRNQLIANIDLQSISNCAGNIVQQPVFVNPIHSSASAINYISNPVSNFPQNHHYPHRIPCYRAAVNNTVDFNPINQTSCSIDNIMNSTPISQTPNSTYSYQTDQASNVADYVVNSSQINQASDFSNTFYESEKAAQLVELKNNYLAQNSNASSLPTYITVPCGRPDCRNKLSLSDISINNALLNNSFSSSVIGDNCHLVNSTPVVNHPQTSFNNVASAFYDESQCLTEENLAAMTKQSERHCVSTEALHNGSSYKASTDIYSEMSDDDISVSTMSLMSDFQNELNIGENVEVGVSPKKTQNSVGNKNFQVNPEPVSKTCFKLSPAKLKFNSSKKDKSKNSLETDSGIGESTQEESNLPSSSKKNKTATDTNTRYNLRSRKSLQTPKYFEAFYKDEEEF